MSKHMNRLIEKGTPHAGWPDGFWSLYGALDEGLAIPEVLPPVDDREFERVFAWPSRSTYAFVQF